MKVNEAKKEIVRNIQKMSGRYTPYNIFSDWVKLCALSTQNSIQVIHNEIWQQREKQYLETIEKYNRDEQKTMALMYGMLAEAFENEITDHLGQIYMESGCGSKNTGQFFTPFHVSYLTAEIAIKKDMSEDETFHINEPSSGGGGMIIAAAKVLLDRGINYQRCMDVNTRDLDWNGVYMTYVQLSILGVKATVNQGDSLAKEAAVETDRIFYTPARMGMIL